MQLVAQGWLVYTMTESPFYLGLVSLARAIPAILFSLVGGAVADRSDPRRVMVVANGAVGLLSAILGVLTLFGAIQVWQIVLIAFLTGTAFAFEMPSRQAIVSRVVDSKDVVNAVGLNSVAFNSAQIVGPALAALLIEWIGEGGVFLLNAASFQAVVTAAVMMRPIPAHASSQRGGLLANVVDGLRYVRQTPELLALLTVNATISLLARPYIQLLPVFARDVLQVGASGLGALNSISGAGALVAAMLVTLLGSYRHRGLIMMSSGAALGAALLVFALSTDFGLSLAAAGAMGLLSGFTGINANSMLQLHSDPRMRGRVMSLHALSMMGVIPLGVMLEGAAGSVVGAPTVVALAGLLTLLVAAAALALVPRVRELE